MSDKEAQQKGTKRSYKRRVTGEAPQRKSARLAKADVKSTAATKKVIEKPKETAVKKQPKGSRKKEETEDEDEASDMAEQSEFDWQNAKSVHDFTVRDIKGEEVTLEKYKGFVLLIVNVASKCGLTSSNYAELVKLDEQYRDKGLRILAFPCNQFGKQEPGSSEAICEFVKKKNATFDFFEKIEVNGKNAHPLYKYLKKAQPGTVLDAIKWNFTKFLVDKEGKPVDRFAPTTSPESLIPDIEKYL